MDLAVLAVAFGLAGFLYLLYLVLSNLVLKKSAVQPQNEPKTPVTRKGASPTDYINILPPSQRHTLQEILQPCKQAPAQPGAALLPLEADYRLAKPETLVCSGFTVGEIKSLGDFPDYSKLSGFPLPRPASNFNIETAIPRPYRPFRWNYHQTMG